MVSRSECLDDISNDVSAHGAEASALPFPLLHAALVAGAHVAARVQHAVDVFKERKKCYIFCNFVNL